VTTDRRTDVLLVDTAEGVAVVTLNRPEARNSLNVALLRALPATMADLDADDDVAVVILTGADPAFCAGLDLKELGSSGDNLSGGGQGVAATPFPDGMRKPVIGAVNGPTVTGGLELALHCDFLIASERARFGDTHARVGVVPGWGLSVLLPQAIGVRRAKEMSLTGRFLTAQEALACGLVNHVVPHPDLLPTARALAADIVGAEQDAARALLAEYKQTSATTVTEGLEIEGRLFREWSRRKFDPDAVEARRRAIVERGRSQTR
jgi:enoyl-CoA hydratase